MSEPIHILSLGAGVQSSTMALMAAKGEIGPMPRFGVFADTQDEPQAVYDYLAYLTPLLPFPVHIVTRSRLSDNLFQWGFSQIPCFTLNGQNNPAKGKRQCTKHWKVVPVNRETRRRLGFFRKRLKPHTVTMWQGISTDEASRMRDNREEWILNRYPLVELGMSRRDCLHWMKANGYAEPPKSACTYCPLKRNDQWQAFKNSGGAEWGQIVAIDRRLNERGEFLHSSCRPIDQIDFVKTPERVQLPLLAECEGMCGV